MGQKSPFPRNSKSETRYEKLETEPREAKSRDYADIPYLDDRADGGSLGEIEQLLERADLHFSQNQTDSAVDDLISAAGRLRDAIDHVDRAYTDAISRLSRSEGEAPPQHSRALALIKARSTLPV